MSLDGPSTARDEAAGYWLSRFWFALPWQRVIHPLASTFTMAAARRGALFAKHTAVLAAKAQHPQALVFQHAPPCALRHIPHARRALIAARAFLRGTPSRPAS
jgi:hypothetical protein